MSKRKLDEGLLKDIFKWLSSNNGIIVQGSIDHILDRAYEREIYIVNMLKVMVKIINGREFCIDVFESASGNCNFKKTIDNIRVYYSIYVVDKCIRVKFRTVI